MKKSKNIRFLLIISVTIIGLLVSCRQLTSPETDEKTTNYIFPESLKGYELYGWVENGENYFTLITGTNRTKSADEIRSDECLATGNSWVKIKVKGVEALQNVATQIPKGEMIFWKGGILGYPAISNDLIIIIKKYFESLGLVFTISS